MKAFVKWSLIAGATLVVLILVIRAVNPEFAAKMDKQAEEKRKADSAKTAMEVQIKAEQLAAAQAKLLGVTFDQATEGFRDMMKIEQGKPINGLDNYIGSAQSLVFQLIGSKDNLTSTSLTLLQDANPEVAKFNSVAIMRYLQQVAGTTDTKQYIEAIKRGGGQYTLNGKRISVTITAMGDVKAAIIEISKAEGK